MIRDGKGGSYTSKVLYVPDLGFHLLSIRELCKLALLVEFSEDQFWVRDRRTRSLICEGFEEHGAYKLPDATSLTHYLPSSAINDLWHVRFGHLNFVYLRQGFRDRMVTGLPDDRVCVALASRGSIIGSLFRKRHPRGLANLLNWYTWICVGRCRLLRLVVMSTFYSLLMTSLD